MATLQYVEAWSKLGHAVTVVTNRFEHEPSLQTGLYRIVRLPLFSTESGENFKLMISSLTNLWTISKLIADSDVVYDAGNWIVAEFLARLLGRPLILHCHDYNLVCPLGSLFNNTRNELCTGCGIIKGAKCVSIHGRERGMPLLGRLILPFSGPIVWRLISHLRSLLGQRYVFVSDRQYSLIKRLQPLVSSRSVRVYNPLPIEEDVETTGLGFVYMGGDVKEKGFSTLLHALSIYKPGLPFIMTKVSERAHSRVRAGGIEVHQRVPRSTLIQILRRVHCVVCPSDWEEPLAYAAIEALSWGKMLIIPASSSIREVICDAPGVIYFDKGSANSLSEALKKASQLSLDDARKLGAANRQSLMTAYSRLQPERQMLSVFSELMEKPL